ncbi:MAG: SufE family protein [Bacteroidota bacterium]
MTIKEKQEDIVKEFEQLIDWEEKYTRIIELGRKLPALDEEFKSEKYKLNGCQSQVWIKAKLADNKIVLEADSDAAIVKGLAALLVNVYSNQTPEEILANPPEFVKKIGIDNHLSPTRKNGLGAMVKQIQMFALAFKLLAKKV